MVSSLFKYICPLLLFLLSTHCSSISLSRSSRPSNVATLSSLSLSSDSIYASYFPLYFQSSVFQYPVTVTADSATVFVQFSTTSYAAQVTVSVTANSTTSASTSASASTLSPYTLTLAPGPSITVIALNVTAQSGLVSDTYILTITRPAPKSSNANLASLSTSPALSYTPTFSSSAFSYTFATVLPNTYATPLADAFSWYSSPPSSNQSIVVYGTVADSGATVTYSVSGASSWSSSSSQVAVTNSQFSFQPALYKGSNFVYIRVTAADGSTRQRTTLQFFVDSTASVANNPDLSTIIFSSSDFVLQPSYSVKNQNYFINAASNDNQATITLTAVGPQTAIVFSADSLSSTNTPSGTGSLNVTFPVSYGYTYVGISTTAADGQNSQFYSIIFYRSAPRTDPHLAQLSFTSPIATSAQFNPSFDPYTYSYVLVLDSSALTSLSFDAVTVDATTSVSFTYSTDFSAGWGSVTPLTQVANLNATASLAVGWNYALFVTTTTTGLYRSYYIAIKRPSTTGSDNARLASPYGLTVSGATTLSRSRFVYAAYLSTSQSQATVNVVTADSGAQIAYAIGDDQGININGTGTATIVVPILRSITAVYIQVTSADQSNVVVYTLFLIAHASHASKDSSLSSLIATSSSSASPLNLTTSPSSPSVYTATVASTSNITVTPTATNSNATVFWFVPAASGSVYDATFVLLSSSQPSFTFSTLSGANVYGIRVVAADGVTTSFFFVSIVQSLNTPSDDSTLAALSLAESTFTKSATGLQVTFESNRHQYFASVSSNITSVTVVFAVSQPGETIALTAFSGNTLVSSQSFGSNVSVSGSFVPIPLTSAVTLIRLLVVSSSGHSSQHYSVLVSQQSSLSASSQSQLQSLSVLGLTLQPAFDPATYKYSVALPNSVTSVTLTATAIASTSSIQVRNAALDATLSSVLSGSSVTISPLVPGWNVIHVRVTAQDGVTTHTYVLLVERAVSDLHLASLTASVNGAPLKWSSAFKPSTKYYRLSFKYTSGYAVSFTATLASNTSSLSYYAGERDDTTSVTFLSAPIGTPFTVTVSAVHTPIEFRVYDVNGITFRSVWVSVVVKGGYDVYLSDLAILEAPLRPYFSANHRRYSTSVDSNVSAITVNASASDPSASIQISNDASGFSSSSAVSNLLASVPLNASHNFVRVSVTSANTFLTRIYTVRVHRALNIPAVSPNANTQLISLSVSSGLLVPQFSPFATNYALTVDAAVSTLTVTAETASIGSTVLVRALNQSDWSGLSSGNTSSALPLVSGSVTVIQVQVTAADGSSFRTISIRVFRKSAAADASIAALSLTTVQGAPLSLTPAFSLFVKEYFVFVASTVTAVSLTATPNAGLVTSITISVTNANGASSQAQNISSNLPTTISTASGINLFSVTVLALDGFTSSTYNVYVIVASAAPSSSASDSTALSGLTVSNSLVLEPAFDAAVSVYLLGVNASSPVVTLTPTANAGASIFVKLFGGANTNSSSDSLSTQITALNPSFTFNAAVGSNTVAIRVVSASALYYQDYLIVAERADLLLRVVETGLVFASGVVSDPFFLGKLNAYYANLFGVEVNRVNCSWSPSSSTSRRLLASSSSSSSSSSSTVSISIAPGSIGSTSNDALSSGLHIFGGQVVAPTDSSYLIASSGTLTATLAASSPSSSVTSAQTSAPTAVATVTPTAIATAAGPTSTAAPTATTTTPTPSTTAPTKAPNSSAPLSAQWSMSALVVSLIAIINYNTCCA